MVDIVLMLALSIGLSWLLRPREHVTPLVDTCKYCGVGELHSDDRGCKIPTARCSKCGAWRG